MHYAELLHVQLFTYSIIIINYQFYSLVISSVRLIMGTPVLLDDNFLGSVVFDYPEQQSENRFFVSAKNFLHEKPAVLQIEVSTSLN